MTGAVTCEYFKLIILYVLGSYYAALPVIVN